jgi:hypothetical protein
MGNKSQEKNIHLSIHTVKKNNQTAKKSPAGAGDGKKYLKMPLEVFWRGLALDERPIFERKRRGRRCVTTNCPRDGPAPAS